MYDHTNIGEIVKQLGSMFDLVKIVDPVKGIEVTVEDGEVMGIGSCFAAVGKGAKCFSCPAAKAVENGRHYEKYEAAGENIRQTAVYPADLTDRHGNIHKLAFELISFIPREYFVTSIKTDMMVDLAIGIPNLSGYLEYAAKLLMSGRIADYDAMYFNIHNFKFINNIFSYTEGNEVIFQYANRLIAELKDDEMLARLGGDNFVVLIRRENADSFIKLLENTDINIETSSGSKHRLNFSARVGAAHLDGIKNPGEVMHRVSVAYQSIKERKDILSIYFCRELLEKEMQMQEIIHGFGKAIANREFVVYYQPKVEISEKKLIGAEALVRWNRHGEIVNPIKFIPILEKEGKVCELDFYVLEEVCRMLKERQDSGKELVCISSNFSRKHLDDPNFVKKVTEIVDKYGVGHEFIEIELTESEEFSDYGTMSIFVDEFRRNGFKTSIDDFGTGYSTMKMLQRTSLDIVKIDRSFIPLSEDYPEKEKALYILRDMVRMTRDLGMKVIAEGVEDDVQLDYLKEMNCDYVQGYVFDKPLPESEFEKRADALYYDRGE